MTLRSKRDLIYAISGIYQKPTKTQKSAHLDRMEVAPGLTRNRQHRTLMTGCKSRRE